MTLRLPNGEEPSRFLLGGEPIEKLSIGSKDLWSNWNLSMDQNLQCWIDASDSSTLTVEDNTRALGEISIQSIEFSTQTSDYGMAIFTTTQPHGLRENEHITLNIGEPWDTNNTGNDISYAAGIINDTQLYVYKDDTTYSNETLTDIFTRVYVDDLAYNDPAGANGEGYMNSGYGAGWRYQLRFYCGQDMTAYDGLKVIPTFPAGQVPMFHGVATGPTIDLTNLNDQIWTLKVHPNNNRVVRLIDGDKQQWVFGAGNSSNQGGWLAPKSGVDAQNATPPPVADWITPGSEQVWIDPNSPVPDTWKTVNGDDIGIGWRASYTSPTPNDYIEITGVYKTDFTQPSPNTGVNNIYFYTAVDSTGATYNSPNATTDKTGSMALNPVESEYPSGSEFSGVGTFAAPASDGGDSTVDNIDVNGQIYEYDDAGMSTYRYEYAPDGGLPGFMAASLRPDLFTIPATYPGLSVNDTGLDTATGSIVAHNKPNVVTSIADKSGNGNTFIGNTSDKPQLNTTTTAGKNTILFNASSIRTGVQGEQIFKCDTLNLQKPSTVHMVYKASTTNDLNSPLELFSGVTTESSKERWRLTTHEQPNNQGGTDADGQYAYPSGGRIQLHAEGRYPASYVFRIEPRAGGGTQVKFYRCIQTHTCPLVDQEPEKAPGYTDSEYWEEVTKPTNNMWDGDNALFPGVHKVTRINSTHVELWSPTTGESRIGGMQRGMLINMEPPGGDDPNNAWNQRWIHVDWPANATAPLSETWQEKLIHLIPTNAGEYTANRHLYTIKNSERSGTYSQWTGNSGFDMPSLNDLDWNPTDCWFIPWDIRKSYSSHQFSYIHGPLVQNWDDLITDSGNFNGNGRYSTTYPVRSNYIFYQERTTDSYVMYNGSRYRCIKSHYADVGDTPTSGIDDLWQYVDDTTIGNPPTYTDQTFYYTMDPVIGRDSDGLPKVSHEQFPTEQPPIACRSFDDPDQVNVLTVRWENEMTAPYMYLNGVYLGQVSEKRVINGTPVGNNFIRTDVTSLQLAANNPNGVVIGADSNDYSNNNGVWSLCEMVVSSNTDIKTLLKTHGYLCNKWDATVDSSFKYYNRLPSTFEDESDSWYPMSENIKPEITTYSDPVTSWLDMNASTETLVTTGTGGHPFVTTSTRSSVYPWEFTTNQTVPVWQNEQISVLTDTQTAYNNQQFYANKLTDNTLTISQSNTPAITVTVPVKMFAGNLGKTTDQPLMDPSSIGSSQYATYIPAPDGASDTGSDWWPHQFQDVKTTGGQTVGQELYQWSPANYPFFNSYWYNQQDQTSLHRRITFGSLVIDESDISAALGGLDQAYVRVEAMDGFLTSFVNYDLAAPALSVGDILYLKRSKTAVADSTQMTNLTAYTVTDYGYPVLTNTDTSGDLEWVDENTGITYPTTYSYYQLSPCSLYTPAGTSEVYGSLAADSGASYTPRIKLENDLERVCYRGSAGHYGITTSSDAWWTEHTGTITLKIFTEDHPTDSQVGTFVSQIGKTGGVVQLDNRTSNNAGHSVSFSQSDTTIRPLRYSEPASVVFDPNPDNVMDTLTTSGNIFDVPNGTELQQYVISLLCRVELPTAGEVDILKQGDDNFKLTVDNQGVLRLNYHGNVHTLTTGDQNVETGKLFLLVMYRDNENGTIHIRLNGVGINTFSAIALTVTDQWELAGGTASGQTIYISRLNAYSGSVVSGDILKLEGEVTRSARSRSLLDNEHRYRFRSVLASDASRRKWTPSDLTSLNIWLDAADTSPSSISSSSGRVSTWHDKSGNSRDFSSGGGTNWNTGISDSQPYTGSRTLNGHNVIDFQGAEHLRSDQTIGTQTLCVFQAGVMDSFEFNDASALSFGNSANDRADLHSFSTAKFFARLTKDLATNDVFLDTNTAIHPGDSYFHSLHIDATGNSIEYFKDGTRYGSIQHQDTSRLNTNNRLILYNYRQIQLTDSNYDIGFRNRGAVDGCLGEVIVTDATVSTADRQKIEGYLAHKWGMTDNLPSDHPYKTLWPTT